MTASDYTHLFGYLNPYYRSAYNVSKRRKSWQVFIILLLNLRIYFLS